MEKSFLWKTTFLTRLQTHENAEPLRIAALHGQLRDWTQALTGVVVATCQDMGWLAAAKGHPLPHLPEVREEYLTLDVTAFDPTPTQPQVWPFPIAIFELENSPNDARIAYSLWKVLCVRAALRVVFCYRRHSEQAAPLVRTLTEQVIHPMPLPVRTTLEGDTLLVLGRRDESDTFPWGFFRWWQLNTNTGQFDLF